LFRQAAQTVCGSCALSAHCWNGGRERTTALLSLLEKPLRADGSLTRLNVPKPFREGCARWVELSEEVARRWSFHMAREGARRRVAQVRSVVSEQLGGVGELLEGLSRKLEAKQVCDGTAEEITEELLQWGCRLHSVECTSEGENRMELRLHIASWEEGVMQPQEIADLLSDLLGLKLEAEENDDAAQADCITLHSCPQWSVSFGAAQHTRSGESLCGDCYSAADLGDRAVLLLSDGMGSGGRAAVDAAMTCGLMERLLRAGFGTRGALRVVNSALLVRAEDESLATSDCVSVDLYTGKAHFSKAGAVCSFLRRGDEIIPIELPSLPLGILREVDCAEQEMQLEEGDVVVLVSDGVGDIEQYSWLRSELLAYDGSEPRMLARNIIAAAEAKRSDEDDDMTALVFQVSCTE
ncbi:MAG: hypothetical protein E7559_07880, partial [Ruminococcaceae bacterium]|nr:hypothetical protein [Oscillospiraceae bacterium]